MGGNLRRTRFATPAGAMKWEDFAPWFYDFLRDELMKGDYRDELSEQAVDSHFLNQINLANRNSVQTVDDVLEATSGAGPGDAVVEINAHSIIYDFATVAYNAGTITGLDPDTNYIIYADDPKREGGAVSYSATENPDLMIARGRVYFGNITTPSAGGGPVTSGGGAGAGVGGGRYDYR